MAYDYSKLRGRIREVCGSEAAFAEAIGLSSVTVSSRLNGKTPFIQDEILAACSILSIDLGEIPVYFFCRKS